MTTEETFAYIHQVSWRGSRPGLSRTRKLLEALGDPQKRLRFIHVAGTNGKGSVCAMLAEILQHQGCRVGLYTSPYLCRFHERIRVNGSCILDEELCALTERVRHFADAMEDPPTEFELITAIAMLYFAEKQCDPVVLEVGMGGTLDSTNVIDTPILAVITALGLDHTAELGPTIRDIAAAKAGIIKPGGAVVCYGGETEAVDVIREACRRTGSLLEFAEPGSADDLPLSLPGRYQRKNAELAVAAVRMLRRRGIAVSESAVRAGLASVRWPGRFEKLSEEPVFIADGGHNPQGVQATADSLACFYPGVGIHFVMGVMADKDVERMIAILLPLAADFIAVCPDNPRAMPAAELAERIRRQGGKAEAAASVEEGVRTALHKAGKEDVICALGSLYAYRQVATCLKETSLVK